MQTGSGAAVEQPQQAELEQRQEVEPQGEGEPGPPEEQAGAPLEQPGPVNPPRMRPMARIKTTMPPWRRLADSGAARRYWMAEP